MHAQKHRLHNPADVLPLREAMWIGANSDSELLLKQSTVVTWGLSGRLECEARTPGVPLVLTTFHGSLSQQVQSRWEGGITHTWLTPLLHSWWGKRTISTSWDTWESICKHIRACYTFWLYMNTHNSHNSSQAKAYNTHQRPNHKLQSSVQKLTGLWF